MRILVIGATRPHGATVICDLLARGHAVRAMTRRPDATAAEHLRGLGVDVVRGDLDHRASLRDALLRCAGVFAWPPYTDDTACASRRGRNLMNAVAGSEIDYAVFGLVAAPGGDCAEHDVEAYARSLELPATFVRLPLSAQAAALAAQIAAMFDDPGRYVGRTIDVVAG